MQILMLKLQGHTKNIPFFKHALAFEKLHFSKIACGAGHVLAITGNWIFICYQL